VAADAQVREAVTLVLTTFYHELDPRALIVAEHDALTRYGHPPAVPANIVKNDASDVAVQQIDAVLPQTSASSAVVVAAALKAIAGATHDRYTTYFTRSEYHRFDDVLDPEKLSGIGVLLQTDPKTKDLRVFFVLPDSPADRGGLRSGDRLLGVNGASTNGWTIAQARSRLLGQPGTPVELTFQHPDDRTPTSVIVSRSSLQPPTVYFSMLPGRIAYIYVATFGAPTSHEFHTAVERSEAAGARAYVVDLRNDGGGIVGTAISILSNFVESGPLVSIESNGGEIATFDADGAAIGPKPLAVLVNGYSASASEITAAAIAESGTGKLIGTRTYGKGVVQSVTQFPDGSAIKITTGRYYTPLNHDINGSGIVPDVVVEENNDARFGIPDKDNQLRKALEIVEAQLSS
jgi:carboxyl-terminal processing protease